MHDLFLVGIAGKKLMHRLIAKHCTHDLSKSREECAILMVWDVGKNPLKDLKKSWAVFLALFHFCKKKSQWGS